MKKLILFLIVNCCIGFSGIFAQTAGVHKDKGSFTIPRSIDIRNNVAIKNSSNNTIYDVQLFVAINQSETLIASIDSIASKDSLRLSLHNLPNIAAVRGRNVILRLTRHNSAATGSQTKELLKLNANFFELKHNLIIELSNSNEVVNKTDADDSVDTIHSNSIQMNETYTSSDQQRKLNSPIFRNSKRNIRDNREINLGNNIVYVNVPLNLNLKDKLILVNQSPYVIVKSTIALVEDGQITHLATTNLVNPSTSAELIRYDDNRLSLLKGQKLAIKTKGYKQSLNANSDLNALIPEEITYDFQVSVREEDHDLYIIVTSDVHNTHVFDF
jgi:hypothetical protein